MMLQISATFMPARINNASGKNALKWYVKHHVQTMLDPFRRIHDHVGRTSMIVSSARVTAVAQSLFADLQAQINVTTDGSNINRTLFNVSYKYVTPFFNQPAPSRSITPC
jgi:hypothetical protein